MLSFVPTPIGNMSDITLNALEALNNCEIILCEDTRVAKKLISLLGRNDMITRNFPNIFHHKTFFSFHSHNQENFLANIKNDFFDKDIVFCTDAGSPCISDPGAALINYARSNHIKYQVFLGGCAFSHAFIKSGLEGAFCFMGFLPSGRKDRLQTLKSHVCLNDKLHIIYYESPHRLIESINDMAEVFCNARFYIYKEMTKFYEREFIGNKHEVLSALGDEILGEYCIIIQKGESNNNILYLDENDILSLDISNKQKSKLLAKITQKSAKEWYRILEEKDS